MTRAHLRQELCAEIVALAAIFGAISAVLFFAPRKVVVTATNINVYRIWPDVLSVGVTRAAWAAMFLLCAIITASLIWRSTAGWILAAVLIVFFVNGTWFASYTLPLIKGQGSAIGTIVFTALLAWPGFVIYRVAHGAGE